MNVEKEFEIKVLLPGFSRLNGNVMEANCTCTLIKGPQNIIIDTRTAWDGAAIVESLNNDLAYQKGKRICYHQTLVTKKNM